MKSLKLSGTWKRVGEQVLVTLVVSAIAFAQAMAAAQVKVQSQKAAGSAQSQSASVAKPSAEKQAEAGTKSERFGGPQEGIRVHGHWVIEVRNADGTFASRSEFENSLQPGGNVALARVLAGFESVRNWRLIIGSSTAALCPSHLANTSFPGSCEIVPASYPSSDSTLFKNLTTVTIHPNDDRIELDGSFTAEAAATIDVVNSAVEAVSAGSTLTDFRVFTSKTLALADQRQVIAGQIVQVSVVISFS